MTRSTTKAALLAAVAVGITLGAGEVRASDPVGIYGVVDRVSVTPLTGGQPTAQIWGTFVVAVTPPGSTYKPEEAYGKVQKGYLLFTCEANQKPLCDAEWNDLKSVAGRGDVVGFGTRWGTAPRVRSAEQARGEPDVYRMNVGVVKMGRNGDYPTIASALKTASSAK
ncbi:MAG: hypothetical protein ABI634_04135 [Acidobacteriota bacterium]